MLIENISCVIIVKNAASTLGSTLDSLADFRDVVLYDNGSTDETIEIAKKYKNVTLVIGEFLGFGPTKNLACSYAKNEWVFSLDADEVLSDEFIKNISNLELNDRNIYTILRENYYKSTQVKHCWGNDIIVRLFNRSKTSFSEEKVHEKVIEEGFKTILISGAVKHYPYNTITDFILKLDRYSTIFAQDNVGKKKSSPSKAFFNAAFSFFKTYFLKKGFLDGYAGLVIAFSHMATNFYKYIKLYELNKKL
ncbi:Glycosyl transferase, family 2 [Sulfurimonas denitrificans DSM 1251]|uniref:Glycosyl transferase, family 2 n=1 Tax=Sulfurimonas denitrificans (strain ATCC 33889 / DSM 1251) TaxID=326298 RepID=Q30T16_SULDN|nr:glycosyltransferase family 2 protein [Sulfurimonas denitrificans]ABB43865.1 Glycosyl transferase, family 2 [Sulfurimonas denitrificans DSM 1251]MDD3442340.1 glycosyltransferase family 2 protein [Sulfurimonas denitrificans]